MLMRNNLPDTSDAEIVVDETHLGTRHVTGIERVTIELFSKHALSPLAVASVEARGRLHMLWQQNVTLPFISLRNRQKIVLTPGFPPSILLTLFGKRIIPYIHDLFLITRWQDLSFLGKFYMSAPFRLAVRKLPRFFVNSETTGEQLRYYCRADAEIILYRPPVRNVFSLAVNEVNHSAMSVKALKLVTVGTVEPRKNLQAAAKILTELRAGGFPDATLDIVGRIGWGGEAEQLAKVPGITLHGYMNPDEVKAVVEGADILLSTSHDEGLGLPLLEVQYAGLPVVVPDRPVFHEVLGFSGTFINTADAPAAVKAIAAIVSSEGWRKLYAAKAQANILRWNELAAADRLKVVAILGSMAASSSLEIG